MAFIDTSDIVAYVAIASGVLSVVVAVTYLGAAGLANRRRRRQEEQRARKQGEVERDLRAIGPKLELFDETVRVGAEAVSKAEAVGRSMSQHMMASVHALTAAMAPIVSVNAQLQALLRLAQGAADARDTAMARKLIAQILEALKTSQGALDRFKPLFDAFNQSVQVLQEALRQMPPSQP